MNVINKKYPGAKANTYRLRKFYKEQLIRKKVVALTKIPDRPQMEKITIQAAELANDVRMAVERGFRIVQLDEVYVTKNTIPTHVWSLKKENIMLDYKEV